MKAVRKLINRSKQLGLTTVEYAVAGALIVVGIAAAFTALGGGVNNTICAVATAIGWSC